jgi:hypothetical protein
MGSDGVAVLGPGLGRPLILTPLPEDAAMRVLASPHRRRVVAAAVAMTAGLGLIAMAIVAFVTGR